MGAYFADLVLCFAEKDGYGRTKGVGVSVFGCGVKPSRGSRLFRCAERKWSAGLWVEMSPEQEVTNSHRYWAQSF